MRRIAHVRRINKKPLLIFAGIVVGVVLLCIGGWWYASDKATSDYRAKLSGYIETAKKELKESSTRLKALATEGDTKKTTDELTTLGNTLTKQAGSVPALPALFGVTVSSQEDAQKRGELVQRLKQLASDAATAKELLAYQNETALVLQEVTTKSGPNAEQQKALADAWNAMNAKLQAIKPPAQAQGTHQQIIGAVTAAQAQIAALSDLFNKKDVGGFAAKQKEIETHINSLRGLANSIQLLNVAQDKTIARDYQNLQNILK